MHSFVAFFNHPMVSFLCGVLRELTMGTIGGMFIARIILRREWQAAVANQQTAAALTRTAEMLSRAVTPTPRAD